MRQRGFTLLEVLVVITLVALVSAVLIPATLRIDAKQEVDVAQSLKSTLIDLSESSLFSDRVTALSINSDSYTAKYFSADEGKFKPISQKPTIQLPDSVTLVWQPEAEENFSSNLNDSIKKHRTKQEQRQKDKGNDTALPDIFFMPGGQATAGLLTISGDSDQIAYLRIDSRGAITIGDKAEFKRAGELPDLILPDDALSYE